MCIMKRKDFIRPHLSCYKLFSFSYSLHASDEDLFSLAHRLSRKSHPSKLWNNVNNFYLRPLSVIWNNENRTLACSRKSNSTSHFRPRTNIKHFSLTQKEYTHFRLLDILIIKIHIDGFLL